MNLFNLTNVIEKPTRVTEHSSTLLDPIIISDYVHYSFSDVLKVPSDISDHDASIIFKECPKFQTISFQREVWLYEQTDHENISSKLDTVDWNALLSDLEFTIKSWSIDITYSDHFGWNALPCDSGECLG
jgi:hypothetical protein